MNNDKRGTLALASLLTFSVIILLLLAAVASEMYLYPSVPAGGDAEPEYVLVPSLVGMPISSARAVLASLGIECKVEPTSSRVANRVENVRYTGEATEDGLSVELGTTVTLLGNEVGADKTVYLTFDDGPTQDNTEYILETLSRYGISATFFVQGRNITRYPEKTLATLEAGHLIACHSYSHDLDRESEGFIYGGTDRMLAEIDAYEAALSEAVGDRAAESIVRAFRFPGGSSTNGRIDKETALEYISAVRARGYKVYDWTSLTGDAEGTTEIVPMIEKMDAGLKKARAESLPLIVLMHDKWAVREGDALSAIIDHLIADGYYFDTLEGCAEYTFAEGVVRG